MKDPAVAAQQQVHQQGMIASVVTLPFRFVGVLFSSLFLCIVIECVGMHFFWPEQGWRHAQGMLNFELAQFSSHFTQSSLLKEPGHTVYQLVDTAYDLIFVRSGMLNWIHDAATQAREPSNSAARDFSYYLSQAYAYLEKYLIASAFVVLVFLVRLLVLILSLPLFVLAAFVGVIDGLVRRDIRRFGAGRESGFVYHRAKASLVPLAVLPWVVYLALPLSVHPLLILLPTSILLGLATDIAVGSFKKYL